MIRLLKLIARKRYGLGCGCSAVLIFIAAIVVTVVLLRWPSSPREVGSGASETAPTPFDGEADAVPRLILSRLWFDKLPEKPRDDVDLWIFFGGGMGIHETGSWYRAAFDVFEFERRGSTIDAQNLQDKSRWKTGFTVRECHDHDPFNICLTLNAVNGKKLELYGFVYEDEMERAAPGSKAVLAAAKARSLNK